jgi:hypothetical protein
MSVVEVRLVYFDGCPNWPTARERLRGVLNQLGWADLPITGVRVETEDEAVASGFAGSPTILIDGTDLFPRSGAWSGGLACRLYLTPAGLAGAPTADAVMTALSERV